MKNTLLEEIERYNRLFSYNTKLTLTENVNIILEKGPNFSAIVSDVRTVFGKELSLLMQDLKITGMDAGRMTKLLEMDAKTFEKEWAKALQGDIKSGFPKGEVGPLVKELSKVDYVKRLTKEVTAKNAAKIAEGKPTLTTTEIESLAERAAAASKSNRDLRAAKFNPRATTIKPPTPAEIANGDKIITTTPIVKKYNWPNLLKWGAGAVALGTLYYIYKKTHGEEPPIVTNDEEPIPPPPPPIPPKPNRYTLCSGTYKKGCKSDVIKQVQGCLGLTPDGKFWKITQAALEAKGFSNGFTDADVSKICGNQVPPPVPVEDEFEDAEGSEAENIILNK